MKNRAAIKKIVGGLAVASGDHIIEIGGGAGALSIPLAAAAATAKAKLTVIERDPELAGTLRGKLLKYFPSAEVLEGDALKIIPTLVWKLEIGNWKLVGNIPYYLTGKLLRILSESDAPPVATVLTIQAEVADRIVAAAPRMNLLTATVRAWANPKILMRLKPADFDPPPEVASAVVRFERNEHLLPLDERERYFKTARILFRQPRKTVWNNLREGSSSGKEMLAEALRKAGIDPALRPQNLSVQMLINLATEIG